ncbi:MAG: hypothetical protein H6595_13140 [Flavobacteriales bacterium]|nr:hypothetical protein [Flavobacteriales bacterium]MCB9168410.1 hypothetical protein [Flavobacteriales bacterium]
MKHVLTSLLLSLPVALSAEQHGLPGGTWQVGIGLGELPMDGSFKPSFTFGYHFNEHLYAGAIYQLRDAIERGGSSFNADAAGLSGAVRTHEDVAERFLLQVRYTPVFRGPYLSAGLVYNGQDSETMRFDDRTRTIAGEPVTGSIVVRQTRPDGWGLALGIGYQYDFRNGLSAGFEWTPAWGQLPDPHYRFGGTAALSAEDRNELERRMDEGFRSSVTNLYKVFHLGLAYRF